MKDFGCGVIVSDNSVSMCFDAESLEIYAACCLRNFSLYSFRAAENLPLPALTICQNYDN